MYKTRMKLNGCDAMYYRNEEKYTPLIRMEDALDDRKKANQIGEAF